MDFKELCERIKILEEKIIRKGISKDHLFEMNVYGWDKTLKKFYRLDDVGLGYPGCFKDLEE